MKVVFETKNLKLIQGDFLEVPLLSESVDLVVTSPPYNLEINYRSYDDTIAYEKYLDFTKKWLRKIYDILKEDGRVCLNIPLDKNKGGHEGIYADVVALAKSIGFKYQSTIIWNKGNVSKRTAWGSWKSASAPQVIAPVETILILYKKSWKKLSKGKSDITEEEFIKWTNGLWTFPGETKKIGHPAPFPLELPKRCIKLFSYVGDTVLDPFVGSGTTLLACAMLNRKGIGIEIDPVYAQMAKKRLLEKKLLFLE